MGEDRFLDRWSRLKRAAEDAAPGAAEPPPAGAGDTGVAGPEPEMTAEEVAALPDPAGLATADELLVFLRRGVPAALRHAALRRMWVLNPAIRDYVDDAREYAMDWNAPGGVPGGGIVSREEAQALAARLFAPREPRAAPVAAVTEEPAARGEAEAPKAQPSQNPAESRVDAARGEDTDVSGGTDPQPPRRRHGGATPV
jgi:hypothetical protein